MVLTLCTASIKIHVRAFAQSFGLLAYLSSCTTIPNYNANSARASIAEMSLIVASGEMSAQSLVAQSIRRIHEIDDNGPKLQTVLSLNPDATSIAIALDRERKAGKIRGPFHGIPILVKDNIETMDDLPTTAGSLALAENDNGRDAPIVASLRQSGAVILGKSNLSQWANFRSTQSVSGWSSIRGQVRNPHALNRSPCGSSSGSGAAVAAGIVMAALGTETNGSIICPAAMNGIVGFKPTVGVLSQDYIIPISASQDTAGPMTQTVKDAAMMMDAMTGNDGHYVSALSIGTPQNTRIGILNFARGEDKGVNARFDEAIEAMKTLGFTIVDIELQEDVEDELWGEDFWDASFDVLKYEFKAALNAYLASTNPAVKFRNLADIIAFNAAHKDAEQTIFDQDILEMSEALGNLKTPAYLNALAFIQKATRQNGIDKILAEHAVDVLMAPSAAPSFLIDHVYGEITLRVQAQDGWPQLQDIRI